ncbi:CAZyme family CE16 [Paecilomyces variotii]|nr:CAZyme family CE16 [Paecilomyces variotii]KAJ9240187.1 CAZyme family CE16 [Paecilomyces variotii]
MNGTTYFFTFGDSYTSTGFNPHGTYPSAENPMGNPSLGEGTSAGGINLVGYLTAVLNTSLILNYNLAISGACINNSVIRGVPGDLVSQVKSFAIHYASQSAWAPWRSGNSIFAIWIGINDIGDSYITADVDSTLPVLLECYFNLVKDLYEANARRFIFLNIPPTTRSPRIKGENHTAVHAEFVQRYNQALKDKIHAFSQNHPDTSVLEHDTWTFMTEMLDNAPFYGFEDAKCQGKGCFWFNDYHPTSGVHKLLAADLLSRMRVVNGT